MKKKYANSKWISRNRFCSRLNLTNDDTIFHGPGLTTGVDFRGQV